MVVKTDSSRMACRGPLDFARDGQNRTACVVALLPAGRLSASVNMVRVGSGYEAAAELLSGPVSALLVDLAALPVAHAALLKLAVRLGVPVVAFGAASAALDGSALAGVRLVRAEDVSDALEEAMAGMKNGPEAFFTPKATSAPQCDVAEIEKAPDPSFVAEKTPCMFDKPLTSDELDALLRD